MMVINPEPDYGAVVLKRNGGSHFRHEGARGFSSSLIVLGLRKIVNIPLEEGQDKYVYAP